MGNGQYQRLCEPRGKLRKVGHREIERTCLDETQQNADGERGFRTRANADRPADPARSTPAKTCIHSAPRISSDLDEFPGLRGIRAPAN
jgi:hypothetical protein